MDPQDSGVYSIREELEERERLLHPRAAHSAASIRRTPEKRSPVRTEYQRDRDRILHSKSFRRLKYKTQVFFAPVDDHFRTRLTHTLELSQIARTIARALQLNEDLTEAIALGHDLGHTPFGHTGEQVLDELCPGGFHHYEQSLRVVDRLERDGRGLNLTEAVRDGILRHSKGKGEIIPDDPARLPATLEGQVVRVADIIAYINHDLDDGLRAGLFRESDIPETARRLLGPTYARRIDTTVIDTIRSSRAGDLRCISMSAEVYGQLVLLRDFLYDRVYLCESSQSVREQIRIMLHTIHTHVLRNPDGFINPYPEADPPERRVIDFIAGMTDRYALKMYKRLVLGDYFFRE